MAKISKEKWKIMGNVFDNFTERILIRYITSHVFDGLKSPIQIGKEANVFTAVNSREDTTLIVKIYRLESCNFNTMYYYIKSDPRYIGTRNNRRQIIFNWVQREFKNLKKSLKVGVNVPRPISFQNNVILMDLATRYGEIAPQLKDCHPEDPVKFFKTVISEIVKMYHGASIVHGDLSAFNILVGDDDIPIIIDMSQGTAVDSMNAKELMIRDLKNVLHFFVKNFDEFREGNREEHFEDYELTEESIYRYITRYKYEKIKQPKKKRQKYVDPYSNKIRPKDRDKAEAAARAKEKEFDSEDDYDEDDDSQNEEE